MTDTIFNSIKGKYMCQSFYTFNRGLLGMLYATTLCVGMLSACGPGNGNSDDDVIVIKDDMGGGDNSDNDGKMPSTDPRCLGQTCSDHGSCMVVAGTPTCLCDEGYGASELSCEKLPVGAPRIKGLNVQTVRLTEGDVVTLEATVRGDGNLTVSWGMEEEDENGVDTYFSIGEFAHKGGESYTAEIFWTELDELFGLTFDEPALSLPLTVHVVDSEGREAMYPLELELYCEGSDTMAICDGRCVDTSSDRDHCGSCFQATPDGAECTSGERICDDAQLVACSEACVPNDDDNCGRCGNTCYGDSTCHVNEGFCDFDEQHPYNPYTTLEVERSSGNTFVVQYTGNEFVLSSNQAPYSMNLVPKYVLDTGHDIAGSSVHTLDLVHDPASEQLSLFFDVSTQQTSSGEHLGQLYMLDHMGDETWSAMTAVGSEPLVTGGYGTYQGFRVHTDAFGIQRLAYRSRRGFEFLSRAGHGESWREDDTFMYSFAAINGSNSSALGYHYDVARRTHYIVFADATSIQFANKSEGDREWTRDTLELSAQFFHTKNDISDMYQTDDGTLHIMYALDDRLYYRQFNPVMKAWSTPEAVTPATPPGSQGDYNPQANSFVVDAQGTQWFATSYNQKMLLHKRQKGYTVWETYFLSGGLDYYYASSHDFAIAFDYQQNPSAHVFFGESGLNIDSISQYSVLTF